MVPARVTWQQKLADLAGSPRRGRASRVLRALRPHFKGSGLDRRNVENWINAGMSPRVLDGVLAAIVKAYGSRGVTLTWLLDGKDTPLPIIGKDASGELVREFVRTAEKAGVSRAAVEVILATTDPAACAFLHRSLGVYRASAFPTGPSATASS